MDIQYYEKPYVVSSPEAELTKVEEKALAELRKNKRLVPLSVVYCLGMQYLFPLDQFDDQKEAKRTINQFCVDKGALFYITAGMSRNNHPFDSTQDQFWLNLILNNEDKVSYIKIELHITSTTITELKREVHGLVNAEKETESIKNILDQEKLTDSEEGSGDEF